MKYLIALLLAATSFMPLVARADMMPEGNHQISNYIVVDNASAYPDHNFYLTFDGVVFGDKAISESPTQVNNNGATNSVVAVRKSDESKIRIIDGTANCGVRCFDLSANEHWSMEAHLNLSFSGFLPDVNPVVKVIQTIHIEALSDTTIVVRRVNIRSEDKNGNKTDQAVSAPVFSRSGGSFSFSAYPWKRSLILGLSTLFAGIGVGVIGCYVTMKTCKK